MLLRKLRSRASLETGLWLLVLGVVGYRMWPQFAAALGVASSSVAAPAFQLTTLDGPVVSSESLRGQVVLVNFWATWCPPCRVEMPGFQRVYDEHKADGFTILGISTDAIGPDRVAAFLRDGGYTYPVAMSAGSVSAAFGTVRTLPTSFLIDRQGRIRYEVQGIFASVALERAVNRLLAEPALPASAAVAAGVPRD